MHSPEPWRVAVIDVDDGGCQLRFRSVIGSEGMTACQGISNWPDGTSVGEYDKANMERIVACVNACQGIPDINGTISMIADMKVAILTNDQELLEIVRKRLVELDTMKPLL
jgi:hypothetical protein